MQPWTIAQEDWGVLLSLLPKEWKDLASSCGAIERLRGFGSEQAVLRTLLLHIGQGYSLRETAVRARMGGLAEVSDVALLKRLRKSEEWFRSLCLALMRENGILLPEAVEGLNVRVVDATLVNEPGKTGSTWRIHYSLRIPSLTCDFFELTPAKGKGNGETLQRYAVAPSDFIMGDRGYSSPVGIEHVVGSGGHVLVRVNTGIMPMVTMKGRGFPLLKELRSIKKPGIIREWSIQIKTEHSAVRGRLCVLRKSKHATMRARRRIHRKARKDGTKLKKETLACAKYVMVFTTLPADRLTAERVLEWYRVRWQIELLFKRLKVLAQLGHLPKSDPESSKAWLYGKLFLALLTEKSVRVSRGFSPWGYGIGTEAPPELLA